jgi:hypothetical protein
MNTLLKILDSTEKNKFYLFLYYFFCPIFYLIEAICFFYYWRKIKLEILTSEDLVNFLDENEFGYKWYKLYKIDIIEPDSFLDQFNIEEMAVKIKAEFTQELTTIIARNTAFDVENYINLTVITNIIPENKIKKYLVEIKYYRYYLLRVNFKFLILWLLILFGLYYLLINVNINWI